jgi:hypothetical protein
MICLMRLNRHGQAHTVFCGSLEAILAWRRKRPWATSTKPTWIEEDLTWMDHRGVRHGPARRFKIDRWCHR